MAAGAVSHVNEQLDTSGLSYARKALMRCGLALRLKGD